MKSRRINRIIHILTAMQSGRKCTIDNLAKTLETSRRTIFRDLKELHSIGVPYRFDSESRSYRIDPEFFLPPMDLNDREALSLLLLAYKIGEQMPLPYKRSALLAALKIENKLPDKIKKYCNSTLDNISIRINPKPFSERIDNTFQKLQTAISHKRKVQISYLIPVEEKEIETEICPYHLIYNQYTWFVLGLSSLHNAVKAFELECIRDMEVLNKCFIEPKAFNVQDYIGNAWSMVPEGRLYHVKLRFLPKIARSVAEVQWHSTQKVRYESDGSAMVEFRVDGINEITWWIVSYGDQVQVITPKILRERVLQINRNALELNKNL